MLQSAAPSIPKPNSTNFKQFSLAKFQIKGGTNSSIQCNGYYNIIRYYYRRKECYRTGKTNWKDWKFVDNGFEWVGGSKDAEVVNNDNGMEIGGRLGSLINFVI